MSIVDNFFVFHSFDNHFLSSHYVPGAEDIAMGY